MTPEDRVLRARVAIMRDPRFLAMSGIMMIGECKLVDDIPTAATNGRDVLIGKQFVDTLDDPTLRFVLLHEYYHVLFMHMTTWKHLFDEDAQTANMAADAVINLMINDLAGPRADGFIRVWPQAILDDQYRSMDTGEVYRAMRRQSQQQQQPQKSAAGGQAQPMDEHRPSNDSQQPGDVGEALSQAEAQEVKQAVDTALRQAAIVAGKLGAGMPRAIKDLMDVKVDRWDVLKEFLRTTAKGDDMATWRKPSRRWMAQDTYMPSRISETAKRIAIGIDTSGSITEAQLCRALTEIVSACETVKPETVDVIYWDAAVAGHEVYEGDTIMTLAEVTKPRGGGGTDPTCMARYLDAKGIKPDCIVQFTDGFVGKAWGEWSAPVLWCISTKGIKAPHGVSLYVPA